MNAKKKIRSILKAIYSDVTKVGSYGGVIPLLREAKQIDKHITKSDVENFLSSEDAYTLHKPARLHYQREKTFVADIGIQYQLDLIEMQKYSSKTKDTTMF